MNSNRIQFWGFTERELASLWRTAFERVDVGICKIFPKNWRNILEKISLELS
ncbi:MAG: hypothetical protein ACJAWV_001822 [Flammeovirgaceae bacterium]|jgi:hypothetical protein